MSQHTPGPWRWEINRKHKRISLCGGKPQFDLTVMEFARWGLNGAQPGFLRKEDGHSLLYKLSECADWVVPIAGREHHAHWCATLNHHDANLIAAAPDLLAALIELRDLMEDVRSGEYTPDSFTLQPANLAIAKAEGRQ